MVIHQAPPREQGEGKRRRGLGEGERREVVGSRKASRREQEWGDERRGDGGMCLGPAAREPGPCLQRCYLASAGWDAAEYARACRARPQRGKPGVLKRQGLFRGALKKAARGVGGGTWRSRAVFAKAPGSSRMPCMGECSLEKLSRPVGIWPC